MRCADDNFASTVSEYSVLCITLGIKLIYIFAEGVAEGRLIFNNLKRSIQ